MAAYEENRKRPKKNSKLRMNVGQTGMRWGNQGYKKRKLNSYVV